MNNTVPQAIFTFAINVNLKDRIQNQYFSFIVFYFNWHHIIFALLSLYHIPFQRK